MNESGPNNSGEVKSTREKIAERFPSPEDWDALQGGMPRVFRNPRKPEARWIVLHVYDEHGDAKKRFKNGRAVDTHASRTDQLSNYRIVRKNWEDITIERDVTVPSFMVSAVHGEVCDNRSAQSGNNNGYKQIKTQPEYEQFINIMNASGMQELRFALNNEGYYMQPLEEIRRPRPITGTDS